MNAHLLNPLVAQTLFDRAENIWKCAIAHNLDVYVQPLLAVYPCCGAVTVEEHTIHRSYGRCGK